MSINSVVLVGRAGMNPEVKTLKDGAKVANVSMAVGRPTKDDQTDWFDIQFWGKSAEIAAQYVKKGNLFGVQGALRKETWQKDGENRSRVLVVANQLRLLETKKKESSENSGTDYFEEANL